MGRRLCLPIDHRGQPALDAVHPVRLHGDGQCLLEGGSCGGLHRLRHTVQQGVGVFTDIRAVHGPSVQVGRAVDLRVVVLPGEVHIDGRDRPGLGRPERRLSADVRRDRDLHRVRARLQVRPEVERVDLPLVYRYTRCDRDAGDGDGSRSVPGRIPVRVRRGHPVLQHRSVAIDESCGSRRHPGDGHPAGDRARSASASFDQQRLQEVLPVLIVEVQIVIVVILPVVDRHAGLPGLDGDILRRAARVDDPDAGIGFDDVFHRIAGRFDCFLELRHHARQRRYCCSQLGRRRSDVAPGQRLLRFGQLLGGIVFDGPGHEGRDIAQADILTRLVLLRIGQGLDFGVGHRADIVRIHRNIIQVVLGCCADVLPCRLHLLRCQGLLAAVGHRAESVRGDVLHGLRRSDRRCRCCLAPVDISEQLVDPRHCLAHIDDILRPGPFYEARCRVNDRGLRQRCQVHGQHEARAHVIAVLGKGKHRRPVDDRTGHQQRLIRHGAHKVRRHAAGQRARLSVPCRGNYKTVRVALSREQVALDLICAGRLFQVYCSLDINYCHYPVSSK